MKAGSIVVIASMALGLVACKSAKKKASDGDADKVYTFNIDQTKEYIDLKLTDLADKFKLIPLETTDESLLGRSEFYVGDQYILAYTTKGVYKFSPEGKFIKKIINVGKGPQEVSTFSPQYFIAENNLLYINDFQHNDNILVYDIVNEQFMEPVKKCIPGRWGSVVVDKNGIIIGTPSDPLKSDSTHYAVIYQNAAGEFISGVLNTKQQKAYMENEKPGYQYATLMPRDKSFNVQFNSDDTLFSLRENRLVPYLILEFDKPRVYPPSVLPQKGDRMIRFPNVDAPGFMIINAMVAENTKEIKQELGSAFLIETNQNYVFLDKFKSTSTLIRTYNDNLIGNTQDVLKILEEKTTAVNFPQILPNNKLVVA
ncbi:MAG: 6-bladed beta-propeller, partial [Bacteroidales bacterium]|nr:6-bladed beta-propeller [Bacteroidales bacterium]